MADIKYQVDVDARGGINNLKQLQDQVQRTNGTFEGLKKLALAAGAAIGTGALVASIKNAMDSVDGLAKSARALGTTTANFQALARSAALAGIGIGELQATAQRLQVSLVNAAEKGAGPAAKSLDKINLSARDLVGLPIDQQLTRITEGLRSISNPAERSAAAVELLGKQGPRMLEVADNMARMREEMQRVGLALSEVDASAIEQAGDAFTELGFIFESIRQKIAAELAPYLTAIARYIKESVLEGDDLGRSFIERIVPGIKLAAQAFAAFVAIVISGKLVFIIAAITQAFFAMVSAIRAAGVMMAIFNGIAAKNPLVLFGTAVAAIFTTGFAVKKVGEAFGEMDEEVKKIVADLERQQAEMQGVLSTAGETTIEFGKQRSEVESTVNAYRQGNADFAKRFELQTKLIRATESQRLEIETLAQIEDNYLRARIDLEKKKQDATKETLAEINRGLGLLKIEYDNQVATARRLINARLEELEIQKEQLRLQKELEESAKRREAVEDSVRGILLDGIDKIRREMERAELDGLVGIQRALREIEIEERRVAEAAKRRVAEQFGDNDPEGLVRAMEEIERASQVIIERRQEAIQGVIEQQRSFSEGWKKAFREYADNATNAAKQAQRIFGTVTRSMEDAIVNFAKTGKFEFKNFVNVVLEELLRIQIQRTFANIFGSGGGSGGGGSLFGGFFATGGMIPPGRFGVVGESGPELVQGPADVTPLGATSVTYNINAVDASSFKEMLARDPSFLYAVTEQGRRRAPGTRR
jgi:lambda family phage tail tape measure protein